MFLLGCFCGAIICTVMGVTGFMLWCTLNLVVRIFNKNAAFTNGAIIGGIIGTAANVSLGSIIQKMI